MGVHGAATAGGSRVTLLHATRPVRPDRGSNHETVRACCRIRSACSRTAGRCTPRGCGRPLADAGDAAIVVDREMQHLLGKGITLKPDAHLHHEQFDLMAQ